ncbi:Stk1 family PASTA domain-containing Ser/Thr kinase [Ammonicoccus fulvus]|uniref:non-specific serine/threonine protein kinase n=1 Tax=Ammonicoccus fulvus TaxID=3138240 RepID=A0ABZ3FNE5_9ACTN
MNQNENDRPTDPGRRAPGTPDSPPTMPRRALPPTDPAEPTPTEVAQDPADDHTVLRPSASEPPPYPGPPPVDPTQDLEATATRALPSNAPRLLGERYELQDVIGRGGMAEVRRAYDTRLGRLVAVKELRTDLAADPTFQARFRREAQSAAGLNHPNIVAVYDTGEEHDPVSGLNIPFIVMELVEGHTLRDILKDGRKILPERALELARGVLDALSYSHKAGIIHRDIKPANVMLTPQGQVKVMDFGIARAISDVSSSMTQTAAVIGTAQYLSPEQARGETVDARSDIYSAGCLLYELLIGRPPFVGDSPVSVAYQHVREMPVPPSQLDNHISGDIDSIVLTALAKDPADRYQSARAMSDDISRLLAGDEVTASVPVAPVPVAPEPAPVVAVTEEEWEPEEEPRRRRAWPVVITLLSLLLVGLLAAGLLWFNRPQEPQGPPQVAVPNVVGQQRAAAEVEIVNARLVPQVREIEGADDTTVGTVTRQNPSTGMLDVGKTVELFVNIGPKKAGLPGDLVGKPVDEVRSRLRDLGFTDVRTTPATKEPGDAVKDSVVAVRPTPGQEYALDTEIVLEVATGTSPVPNWVGWNQASVDQDRRTKGFTNVRFETRETDNPGEVGIVISTDPRAGTEIERSDEIVVVIGRARPAPSPTPVPSPEPTYEPGGGPEDTFTPPPPPPSVTTPTPTPSPAAR